MAQLGNAFDSGQHDDMNNFDPIPAAEYTAQVTGSDVKATKDKTGKYIALEFTVLTGEFKGRKIWQNLNIVNKNPVTVEIAEKELATLCRAVGKSVIQDTQELHGKPMLMKVRIVPAKGQYPPKNAPTGYTAIGAGSAPSGDGEDGDDAPWGDEEKTENETEETPDGFPGSDEDSLPDDDIPY